MENIDLIRKVAWIFHRKTKMDWDDLFQEAALAYLEGLKNYDPSKGSISAYMWYVLDSRLVNYLKREQVHVKSLKSIDLAKKKTYTTTSFLECLSNDGRKIIDIVSQTPGAFTMRSPKEGQERLRKVLRQNGWTARRINNGFRDIQTVLSFS